MKETFNPIDEAAYYQAKAKELDEKVLSIWRKAASEKTERYDAEKGRLVTIDNPEYSNPQTLRETIKQAVLDGRAAIELPGAVIKKDGLNIDAFKSVASIGNQTIEKPFLIVADDPVFMVPEGVAVYRSNGSRGKYWALCGTRLVECIDSNGAAITFGIASEGYKAKQTRLKREEEERQRLAELERLKRETEAEEARQESQLSILKALPADKFKKLMAMING